MDRYSPLAGVGAVVLWVVGAFLLEKDDRPDGKDTAQFVAWVEKNDTSILAGSIVFAFGVLLFLWMLGSLRSTLAAAEGGTAHLAHRRLLLRRRRAVLESVDRGVGDVVVVERSLTPIPLLLATALVSLRRGPLPRWFAWVSIALAVILAVPPIGWLGVFVGLPLWVLLVSVLLFRRGAGDALDATT